MGVWDALGRVVAGTTGNLFQVQKISLVAVRDCSFYLVKRMFIEVEEGLRPQGQDQRIEPATGKSVSDRLKVTVS